MRCSDTAKEQLRRKINKKQKSKVRKQQARSSAPVYQDSKLDSSYPNIPMDSVQKELMRIKKLKAQEIENQRYQHRYFLENKFRNSNFQLEKNKIIRDAKFENTIAKREKRILMRKVE